ncbi:MAG: hypothetical protein HYW25_05035 [Candidatus Aenigmarchaeota archaeon]|nr:hypothetical protein [Candidatus Aenigmarchaeota archaeon]
MTEPYRKGMEVDFHGGEYIITDREREGGEWLYSIKELDGGRTPVCFYRIPHNDLMPLKRDVEG